MPLFKSERLENPRLVPSGGVILDTTHPLARGLVCFYVPCISLCDFAGRYPSLSARAGATVPFITPVGPGLLTNATDGTGGLITTAASLPSVDYSNGASLFTVEQRFANSSNTAGLNWSLGLTSSSGSTGNFAIYADANTAYPSVDVNGVYYNTSGNSFNYPLNVNRTALTWTPSTAPSLYCNGATVAPPWAYNGGTNASIGTPTGVTMGCATGTSNIAGAFWNRALTANEAEWLTLEPFAMFRQQQRRRFLQVITGNNPATGTSTLGPLKAAGTAASTNAATGAPALAITTAAVAASTNAATAAPAVSPLKAAGTAASVNASTATATLGQFLATVAASQINAAAAAPAIGPLQAAGLGGTTAAASPTLPPLTAAGTASQTNAATGTGPIGLGATSTASQANAATGGAALAITTTATGSAILWLRSRMLARTITLPIGPGADWSSFEWPSKDPSDILDYAIDATAWLSDAGLSISGTPSMLASPGVQADILNVSGGIINLEIGGGTPSTTAQVAVSLLTSGSYMLHVVVALPIRAGEIGLVATTAPIPPTLTP